MTGWLHHRQRQAGKYAKKSYKLEVRRLNAPVKAAKKAAKLQERTTQSLQREHRQAVRALPAPLRPDERPTGFAPRRPDLPR